MPWRLTNRGRVGAQRFGYNDHFGQDYDAYVNAAFTFRALNARIWRDALPWQRIEPSAGVYNFSPSGDTGGQDFFNFLADQISASYDYFHYWVIQYQNSNYTTDITSATWRQHLAEAMIEVATRLIAAGQPANRIVFCLDNEPNSSATAMAGWWQGSGGEVNYTRTAQHIRAALKAYNPALRLAHGEGIDGDHSFYNSWRAIQENDPGYFAGMDILSNHLYSDVYPTLASPEVLFARCEPYFRTQLTRAASAGRTDITTAITECGGGLAETPGPTLWPRTSRMPFIFSVLPGLEFYIHYAGRDVVNDYGIMESDALTLRYTATILGEAFAHLNIATDRKMYTDETNVAVKMKVPGSERLALWTSTGSTLTELSIFADRTGTLKKQVIGGATTTQALGPGLNTVSPLTLSDFTTVLYTDDGTNIAFPQFESQGQQIIFSQGNVGAVKAKPGISYSQGVLTPAGNSVDVHLDGQEMVYSQGNLTTGLRLVGQSQTLAQGAFENQRTHALVGQSFGYSQGTLGIGVDAEDTSVIMGLGSMAVGFAVTPPGVAEAYQQGTITAGNVRLTGQLVVLSTYTITPSSSRALVGQGVSYFQGVLTPSSPDKNVPLSGQVIGYSQGALTPQSTGGTSSRELVGQEISYGQGSMTAVVRGPKGDWQAEEAVTPETPPVIWTKEPALEI